MKVSYVYGMFKEYTVEVEDVSKAYIPSNGDEVSLLGAVGMGSVKFKVIGRSYNPISDVLIISLTEYNPNFHV